MATNKLARSKTLWLLAALCCAAPLTAQAVPAAPLVYDTASIKPNKAGENGMRIMMPNDSFTATNVNLKLIIQIAYNLTSQDQVVGLTGWANSSNFDIVAKMDAETYAQIKALPRDAANDQRKLMLQALLVDRFHLKTHRETKETQVYNLVLARGGSKMKDATPDRVDADAPTGPPKPGDPPRNGMMMMRSGELTGTGIAVGGLVNILSQQLHRQVFDKTGLTGKYDFTLKYAREDAPAQPTDATSAEQAPSLVVALEEQLGLKLDSVKGPVDTIIVDHVEQPSEN